MRQKNMIITIAFLLYLAFFSLGSLIVKDREFSDMENRNLQTFPEVTAKTLASGSFMDEFESYMQDQIILKDELVKINTTVSYVLNQRLINGVYFADNGMLIQDYAYNEQQLEQNISYVNEFVSENPDFEYTWMVVPTAGAIYEESLPKNAPYDSQKLALDYLNQHVSDSINLIIPEQNLTEHKSEYLFYDTDHHWTQHGAYYGYQALCEGMGLTPFEKEKYQINESSKTFYGSLYSKAPKAGTKPDSIYLYENPSGVYHVEYPDVGDSRDGLYNYENLMIKDKYTTYLGGNHPLVTVTSNAENKESVLVVKDSYAHTLLPFLADHFSEMHVIDLRYYHQSVSEYAREHGIKKIIFINNVDFVTTDNNFLWLY